MTSSETTRLPLTARQPFWQRLIDRRHTVIAFLAIAGIVINVVLRYVVGWDEVAARSPLWGVLILGGFPLVAELIVALFQRRFGSDLLAGISIVTAVLLGEYLAGALVVLMLSGGEALESYAVQRASSVLDALARRMPSVAHRKSARGVQEIPLDQIEINDEILVLPHEVCPVDGIVLEGHGAMDEAYLTGEPYQVSKSVGAEVISGAINGESALTVQATRLPVDSRYARIMRVMQHSQQERPQLRRLGDQLGAFYTPLAVSIALIAWLISGEAVRFLAVLVIATPCPLLIAIPVAIIGAISLSARRSIIVRDPAILEQLAGCSTMIFDKTGTLTYGEPAFVGEFVGAKFDATTLLRWTASLERYSKHPLAGPVIEEAKKRKIELLPADRVEERPGQGLIGEVQHHEVRVTSRKQFLREFSDDEALLPPVTGGLECVVLVDGTYAATYHFRDEPRPEGTPFVTHLAPAHQFHKVMLVSGDRPAEVEYLAKRVGITDVHAGKSPEEKLEIVKAETAQARTIYVGDGINDAPAMLAATVGLAMGQRSDVTTEAAGAVIMDNMLGKVDELLHIGERMRRIAMQSAVGGMALSVIGMFIAAAGYLPPVAGAILQEAIDVFAVLNALRASWAPRSLSDYEHLGE